MPRVDVADVARAEPEVRVDLLGGEDGVGLQGHRDAEVAEHTARAAALAADKDVLGAHVAVHDLQAVQALQALRHVGDHPQAFGQGLPAGHGVGQGPVRIEGERAEGLRGIGPWIRGEAGYDPRNLEALRQAVVVRELPPKTADRLRVGEQIVADHLDDGRAGRRERRVAHQDDGAHAALGDQALEAARAGQAGVAAPVRVDPLRLVPGFDNGHIGGGHSLPLPGSMRRGLDHYRVAGGPARELRRDANAGRLGELHLEGRPAAPVPLAAAPARPLDEPLAQLGGHLRQHRRPPAEITHRQGHPDAIGEHIPALEALRAPLHLGLDSGENSLERIHRRTTRPNGSASGAGPDAAARRGPAFSLPTVCHLV